MIKRNEERLVEVRKAMREGPGEVIVSEIANKEEMYNNARLYSSMHFEPGCGIGVHDHNNESEIFYITKGQLTYYEDDNEYILNEGDIAILESGHSHSIVNKSDKAAELIALIILDK